LSKDGYVSDVKMKVGMYTEHRMTQD